MEGVHSKRPIEQLLIVEDERSQREMLGEIMETEGFDVILCSDCEEALSCLQTRSIGAVILDLHLGDYSSQHVLSEIGGFAHKVPIIIHTGHGSYESARKALNFGIFAYVEKGSDPQELIRYVHRAFQHQIRLVAEELEALVAKRTTALEHMVQQWQTTFDAIPDMISIQDCDCRLISVNKAYTEALGLTKEQLMGRPCYEVIHGRKGPLDDCPHRETLISGKVVTLECYNSRLDAYLEVTTSPFRDESGNIVGVVHYARNVTERKQAEIAITELNEMLQHTVRELRQSNADLYEFARISAHDLKTPVRGLGMAAEWLQQDHAHTLDGDGKELVTFLLEGARRLDVLLDAVLRYACTVRSRGSQDWVDLNELVSGVLDTLQPPARVKITVEDQLPTVCCERRHMQQVFEQLLGNAIRYADPNNGQVAIRCSGEDGEWRFCAADNGPGIAGPYREKIFKLFQTLSRKGKKETAGLGLPLTKKILELYSGRIWVESEPGQGSRFYFTLPKMEEVRQYDRKTTVATG